MAHLVLQYGQIYIPTKALLNTFQRKDQYIVLGELQKKQKQAKGVNMQVQLHVK